MTPSWTCLAQILVRFALRQAVSKIQGRQKSEMHRMTKTDIELLTVNITLYTLNT